MSDVVIDICELKAKGRTNAEIMKESEYGYLGITEQMISQVIADFYDPDLYE